MFGFLLVIALLALLAWLLVPGATFRVVFLDGQLVKHRGRVPDAVRADFEDLARRWGVSGTVSLYGRKELRFSGPISEADQQRFRNTFFISRRGAP